MRSHGDGLAVLLLLVFSLMADGIMEAVGPGGFIQAATIALTVSTALHNIPTAKRRKGPVSHQPTKALRYKAH